MERIAKWDQAQFRCQKWNLSPQILTSPVADVTTMELDFLPLVDEGGVLQEYDRGDEVTAEDCDEDLDGVVEHGEGVVQFAEEIKHHRCGKGALESEVGRTTTTWEEGLS